MYQEKGNIKNPEKGRESPIFKKMYDRWAHHELNAEWTLVVSWVDDGGGLERPASDSERGNPAGHPGRQGGGELAGALELKRSIIWPVY